MQFCLKFYKKDVVKSNYLNSRALRKLKGRWFARRQINCEFTCIKSWRTAICGMSKCPKGRACNFLHVFKNPKNEYDVKSPPRWAKRQDGQESSKRESSRRSENKFVTKLFILFIQ